MKQTSAYPYYQRRSIRLPGYDYSKAGSYFVTLVTHQREHLFGQVVDGEVVLSEEGKIVQEVWNALPTRFLQVKTDCHVIMPDHFHAIITIEPGDESTEVEDPEGAGAADSPDSHESPVRAHPVRAVSQESPVRAVSQESPVRAVSHDSPERAHPVRAVSHESPVRAHPVRAVSHESPVRAHPVRAIHELPLQEALQDLPLRASTELDSETIRKRRRLMLLPKVIGYFKMNSAKKINLLRQTAGSPVWLRNYYEHIIMNDEEYARIWDYIVLNPRNWKGKDEWRNLTGGAISSNHLPPFG